MTSYLRDGSQPMDEAIRSAMSQPADMQLAIMVRPPARRIAFRAVALY